MCVLTWSRISSIFLQFPDRPAKEEWKKVEGKIKIGNFYESLTLATHRKLRKGIFVWLSVSEMCVKNPFNSSHIYKNSIHAWDKKKSSFLWLFGIKMMRNNVFIPSFYPSSHHIAFPTLENVDKILFPEISHISKNLPKKKAFNGPKLRNRLDSSSEWILILL